MQISPVLSLIYPTWRPDQRRPGGSVVKNLPANAGGIRDTGSVCGSGRAPEENVATHSSILAWRIPRTEEPGGLRSIGSQRLRHNWSDLSTRILTTFLMTAKLGDSSSSQSPSYSQWTLHPYGMSSSSLQFPNTQLYFGFSGVKAWLWWLSKQTFFFPLFKILSSLEV